MTNAVARTNGNDLKAIIDETMVVGDFSKLTMAQRHSYIMTLCEQLQINPLSRPIEFMTINGRLVPYAKRDCADQLRKRDRISVKIVSQAVDDELYVVHAQAQTPDGRTDEDFGAVNIGKLSGEMRANAMLKAVTKAKRRVTLSICGLGFLDETEVEDIPATVKMPKKDLRPRFQEMLNEIRAQKTRAELVEWGNANREFKANFPTDWQNELDAAFYGHLTELQQYEHTKHEQLKKGLHHPMPDPTGSITLWLTWLDGECSKLSTTKALETYWHTTVNPIVEKMLPPDQVDALALFDKHQGRIGA